MAADWGLILGVVSVIGIPACTGIGVAMAARTPGQFRFARYCFAAAGCLTLPAWAWLTNGLELSPARLAFTAIIGAVTAISVVFSWNWVSQLETHEISQKVPISIAANCHEEMLPKTFGPNEIINALNLFPLPSGNGGRGLAELSNHSGKEWQWRIRPEGAFGGMATKCQITNYGPVPVLDLTLTLDLSFYQVVPVSNNPNAHSIGPLKLRRPWIIDVQKIDVGPSNSFTFYIYNSTHDTFANVLLPKTAELRRLGEKTQEMVTLDVPKIGGEIPMQFWPLMDTPTNASTPQQ